MDDKHLQYVLRLEALNRVPAYEWLVNFLAVRAVQHRFAVYLYTNIK